GGACVGAARGRGGGRRRVLVPRAPGPLCPRGPIPADVLNDAVRTVHARLDALDPAVLGGEQRALEAELSAWMEQHRVRVERISFRHGADMRYVGQSYEVEVPVEPGWGARELRGAFRTAHERVFGHADPHAPVEVVNLRVQLCGIRPRVPLVEAGPGAGGPARGSRSVWLDGRPVEASVYERASLGRGDRVQGPAIVEQPDTTVLVPAGAAADVDRFGNLLMAMEA